jgi:hypothetical protein
MRPCVKRGSFHDNLLPVERRRLATAGGFVWAVDLYVRRCLVSAHLLTRRRVTACLDCRGRRWLAALDFRAIGICYRLWASQIYFVSLRDHVRGRGSALVVVSFQG